MSRAEEPCKGTLRTFISDDGLPRDEETVLADLATELGIDPRRAFDLREQVKDAGARGDAP